MNYSAFPRSTFGFRASIALLPLIFAVLPAGCSSKSEVVAPLAVSAPLTTPVAAVVPQPSPETVVWSDPSMGEPRGEFKTYHGPFDSGPTSVTVDGLPEHKWVRVRFKLLVMGKWNGSSRAWGPHLWSLHLHGAQQLMIASFCNMGKETASWPQSFPDDYPWGVHYAFTGGTALDADMPFRAPAEDTGYSVSSTVYPVEVVFPHTGKSMRLNFDGVYWAPPQEIGHRWGVADFEYVTTTEPVALAEGEMEQLWSELASEDAVVANAAMWRMISTGEKVAAFIDEMVARFPEGAPVPDELKVTNRYEALRLRRAVKIIRIVRPGDMWEARWALSLAYPREDWICDPVY